MTDALVSTAWLDEHLADASVVVADCRWYLGDSEGGRRAYATSHIPRAIYFDLEEDLSARDGPGRHPLPDRDDFARVLEGKGISTGSTVVAYDDRGGAVAARLWWMLRWLGHEASAVLDGGFTAWIAEGRPTTTAIEFAPSGSFAVRAPLARTIDREDVAAVIGTTRIIDARDAARYRGETEPVDPVAGHIPTAVSLPYTGNLGIDDRFLATDALRSRYAAGADTTIVYCGSGVTACHNLLAMHVAGVAGGILYPGSWSDWSVAGGAVATGDSP